MTAANPKVDLATTFIIDTVKEIWPDFSINQHLLDNPTSEFVIEFCQYFHITIREELYRTINCKSPLAEELKTNNDSIFPLLRFINHYLRKCHPSETDLTNILTLTDLYEPTAKRTQLRFKILLNIVLFYKQQAPGAQEVIARRQAKKGIVDQNNVKIERRREERGKNAEILANQEDKLRKIRDQKEKANVRYRSLEEKRKIDEEHHAELRYKIQEVVSTYKNKRMVISTLISNIQHLREQVVSEENFNSLQDLKNNLLKKSSELDIAINNLAENLANRIPMTEHFRKLKKNLQNLTSMTPEFTILLSCNLSNTKQLETVEGKLGQFSDKLNILNETKIKLMKTIQMTEEMVQSNIIKYATLRKKLQEDLQEVQKEIKEEAEQQHQIKYEEKLLEKECEVLSNSCDEIVRQNEKFNSYAASTYQDMLASENKVVKKFNSICERFVNKLS